MEKQLFSGQAFSGSGQGNRKRPKLTSLPIASHPTWNESRVVTYRLDAKQVVSRVLNHLPRRAVL